MTMYDKAIEAAEQAHAGADPDNGDGPMRRAIVAWCKAEMGKSCGPVRTWLRDKARALNDG